MCEETLGIYWHPCARNTYHWRFYYIEDSPTPNTGYTGAWYRIHWRLIQDSLALNTGFTGAWYKILWRFVKDSLVLDSGLLAPNTGFPGACMRFSLALNTLLIHRHLLKQLTNLNFNFFAVTTDGTPPQCSECLEVDNTKRRRMELIDAGLMFNSPYPPLLRKERTVDVILSFDFSAREADEERPFKVKWSTWRPETSLFVMTKLCKTGSFNLNTTRASLLL